ncbi:MAG: B12-binding domain-containing radical SAM protein [Candidatus Omnitrophica bacterium]|nr:B12-binding domain-containing radical SAM protein [Candidatus Omnitrophota bacterium]
MVSALAPSPRGVERPFADYVRQFGNPAPDTDATVVLIKPPIVFSAKAYSTPVTMPIGLAYLAAVLERARYRVRLIDCPGEAMDQIRRVGQGPYQVQGLTVDETIRRIPASVAIIGVSVMFSQEWPCVRAFVARLREAFPKARVVLGGEAVTALPEYTLRDSPAIDGLVLGEGELAFLQVCHAMLAGQPWDQVPGVAFLRDGAFVTTGLSPRLTNLHDYPWPAWHLVPVEAYFRPNFTMGPSRGRNIGVLATRGCPYSCTFCSNPSMWTTRYVMREPEDVVEEIQTYIARYGVNCIDFYDLTAIVKKEWIVKFCQTLVARRLTISWQLPSGTRSEALDAETLDLLYRTGCRYLVYAPESGSPDVLTAVKKKLSLTRVTGSIREAKRRGLVVKINLIIGFPFEHRRAMWKSVAFAWRMAWSGVDDCNIATFTPYPGSELFRELVASGEIPALNDAYFESLLTQFDFTVPKSLCRHVGAAELLLYRVLGMAVFYALTYLRRPSRLWALRRAAAAERFEARSLFEQRVSDLFRRHRAFRPRQQTA